ncbi:MAG: hypothetical protein CMJ75_18545 [Planctomycetaceae bacterium]|nr:hypothetical protein [Planctomycetaceae bacterium]
MESLREAYGSEIGRRLEFEFDLLLKCGFDPSELVVIDLEDDEEPTVMPDIVVKGMTHDDG